MKVLLSCVGTSDPIREHKDGPLLHILRKYRPDVVVLFVTAEIRKLDLGDNRHAKIRYHMKTAWNYEPEWYEEFLDIKAVHDLDLVYEALSPVVEKYLLQYGKEELLINVSSGTPQMQHRMIDLAKDVRYKKCSAIQVANPGKASGQGGRSNTNVYDIDAEIRENLDELPGYYDRCAVVEMVAVKRMQDWQKMRGILDLRDFEAASKMDMLTVDAGYMLEHLLYRSRLNYEKALEAAANLDKSVQDQLYPIRFTEAESDAKSLCEYYLILRNMISQTRNDSNEEVKLSVEEMEAASGRITEFVLRLNPFIVGLQEALIERLLQEQYQFSLKDLILKHPSGKRIFVIENLKTRSVQLFEQTTRFFGTEIHDAPMSIRMGNALLRSLGAPKHVCKFFLECEKLNKLLRDPAAHELRHFTEEDIENCIHYGSEKLISQIEAFIPMVFPQYSEEDFKKYYHVYDIGIAYILNNK